MTVSIRQTIVFGLFAAALAWFVVTIGPANSQAETKKQEEPKEKEEEAEKGE